MRAGVPSDPYLMTGYDRKRITLSARDATRVAVEIDVDGTGLWIPYRAFDLKAGGEIEHRFPEGFSAYWVRTVSTKDTVASAILEYD